MNKNNMSQWVAAQEERSLLENGYLYVGRLEYGGVVSVVFRHPRNGNRAKILITNESVSLYVNRKLKNKTDTRVYGTKMY